MGTGSPARPIWGRRTAQGAARAGGCVYCSGADCRPDRGASSWASSGPIGAAESAPPVTAPSLTLYRPTANTITVDLTNKSGRSSAHEALLGRSAQKNRKSRTRGRRSAQVRARSPLRRHSLSSVKRYARRIANRGASLEPRKGGGRPPKVVDQRPRRSFSKRAHRSARRPPPSPKDATTSWSSSPARLRATPP